MLRGMVFMDYMNFDISLQSYYTNLGKHTPKLDYGQMFRNIAKSKDADFLKGFIFAPAPDQFLMNDEKLKNNYKWMEGMANAKYIDVVFGRYIARPTNPDIPMEVTNRLTYYKVEKGTDINLAIHALNKAHFNSYDAAFIMSGDTDYINVYRLLKSIGKIVIVVGVGYQNLSKIIPEVDDFVMLREDFFNSCTRENKK